MGYKAFLDLSYKIVCFNYYKFIKSIEYHTILIQLQVTTIQRQIIKVANGFNR